MFLLAVWSGLWRTSPAEREIITQNNKTGENKKTLLMPWTLWRIILWQICSAALLSMQCCIISYIAIITLTPFLLVHCIYMETVLHTSPSCFVSVSAAAWWDAGQWLPAGNRIQHPERADQTSKSSSNDHRYGDREVHCVSFSVFRMVPLEQQMLSLYVELSRRCTFCLSIGWVCSVETAVRSFGILIVCRPCCCWCFLGCVYRGSELQAPLHGLYAYCKNS